MIDFPNYCVKGCSVGGIMASAQVAIHILLGFFEPHQASDFQQYTKAGTGQIVPFSDRRILVRYTNRRKKNI